MFEALQSPKTFAPFTDEDGAESQCLADALAYKDEVVFTWLDDTLRRNRQSPLAHYPYVDPSAPARL